METESNNYWDERYLEENIPWDIGYANSGIIKYVQRQFPLTTRILIPGAGVGHEAAKLYALGYENVFVNEWSQSAKERMLAVYPGFPAENILIGDFFALRGCYPLIIEQTFFCALPPARRMDYVKKVKELLAHDGVFAGVFFDRTFADEGPPFGGDAAEYRALFSREFKVSVTSPWKDSIAPRAGTECWLEARVS
jgi:methyl halide transferase